MNRINSNSKNASSMIYLERMAEPVASYEGNSIYLGKSKIFNIPFFLNLNELLNRNIAILGMSGSGKSYFLKSFIVKMNTQLSANILIIDWNNEYKNLVNFLDGNVLTLGLNLSINIFDFYNLENVKNISNITKIISKYLELENDESYCIYNKIINRKSRKKFNLNLLIGEFAKDNEIISNKISSKLLQLKSNPLFGDLTNFPIEKLLDGITSINFSMLKDDKQRDDISSVIINIAIEIMHKMSIERKTNRTECIVVFDEAWRLIRNSEDIGVLFREGRKYGFCVAVATQLLDDINNEILSNTASLFLFRLQNESDYKPLVNNGVIDETEKIKIANMPIGMCMVSLSKKEDNGAPSKFFIKRIDGVETDIYTIYDDNMKIKISQKLFRESTKKLLADEATKTRVIDFAFQNNNELQITNFINFLICEKIERPEIIFYLRNLGLKDINIIEAYDNVVRGSILKDKLI